MAASDVLVEARGGVLTITLNRPAKLNAVTAAMHAAMHEAFERLAADPDLHLCVLRSACERAFRSEENTSELQSLMRLSYAVFCLKKKKRRTTTSRTNPT